MLNHCRHYYKAHALKTRSERISQIAQLFTHKLPIPSTAKEEEITRIAEQLAAIAKDRIEHSSFLTDNNEA